MYLHDNGFQDFQGKGLRHYSHTRGGGDPHGGEELFVVFAFLFAKMSSDRFAHHLKLFKYIFWEQAFRNLKKRRGDYHRLCTTGIPDEIQERRTRKACLRCMVTKGTLVSGRQVRQMLRCWVQTSTALWQPNYDGRSFAYNRFQGVGFGV